MFKNRFEIRKWLNNNQIKRYKIKDDFTVDVDGDVIMYNMGLKTIPVQFGHISGAFECFGNYLTSLKGSPRRVDGWFDCSCNKLANLKYAPLQVGGGFDCSGNKLISLKGAPLQVGGDFDCSNNMLITLDGIPRDLVGLFFCNNNMIIDLMPIKHLPNITHNNKQDVIKGYYLKLLTFHKK